MKLQNLLLAILFMPFSHITFGDNIGCISRAEMGEHVQGATLYNRDKELKISNLAHFDLDSMTLKSAEGNLTELEQVEPNVYKTKETNGVPTYFITDREKSIVIEVKADRGAIYSKILLCN